MENLTREQLNFMDNARANLLHELGASVGVQHLLVINGAHTAGFKAGLEYSQAEVERLRAACDVASRYIEKLNPRNEEDYKEASAVLAGLRAALGGE